MQFSTLFCYYFELYFRGMKYFSFLLLLPLFYSCGNKSELREDSLYSRHLQRQVTLTVFNTPLPDEKDEWNLLILNDGQDFAKFRAAEQADSLWDAGKIKPLIIVGVHAADREEEFGVAGKPDFAGRGRKAEDYDEFINNELLPFIRKQASVRKFQSLGIAGASLGGLSAMDIAWNHADKFSVMGAFSGSFWWRDKDLSDKSYRDDRNRIMQAKLLASRKRPETKFFFSAGELEETSDRDSDSIIDVIDDTQDLITLLKEKRRIPASSIQFRVLPFGKHDHATWAGVFPEFLLWAYRK